MNSAADPYSQRMSPWFKIGGFPALLVLGLIFFVLASSRIRNGWHHNVPLDQPTRGAGSLPPKVEP